MKNENKETVMVELAELILATKADAMATAVSMIRENIGTLMYNKTEGNFRDMKRLPKEVRDFLREVEEEIFAPMEQQAVEILNEADVPEAPFSMEGLEVEIPAEAFAEIDMDEMFSEVLKHIMGLGNDSN